MRPTIGYAFRTKNNLHINPFWSTANYWNPTMNNIKNAITTHFKCSHCGYSHSQVSCPAYGIECFSCHSTGHFIALCKKPCNNWNSRDKCIKLSSRTWFQRPSSHRCPSRSTRRGRLSHHSTSCSPSINCSYSYRSLHNPDKRSSTPYRHQVSHFSMIKSQSSHREGKLITDTTSDGHASFYTTL